ncbi:MAG: AMP-binding protein, partial [Thermomicrobium sp.]|nr:AMP-binding protein [Thermomicrobium sp.]
MPDELGASAVGAIEGLLVETRRFPPPPDFAAQANINDPGIYERARRDPEGFWATIARELDWDEPWHTVMEWTPPWVKWFVGGKLNASVNCVDRHLRAGRRTKAAIIWEGEPGDERILTYQDLYREVNRAALALRSLGVQNGDPVAIYLPMIPGFPIAMLACARIGAGPSGVVGG